MKEKDKNSDKMDVEGESVSVILVEHPEIEARADHMDFSSKGAFLHWKIQCENKFVVKGKVDPDKMRFVDVCSTFGFKNEDLGIIRKILGDVKVYTRDQIGVKFFEKRKSSTGLTEFMPMTFKYWSKFACANQTGNLVKRQQQVASVSALSGKSERLFSLDITSLISNEAQAGIDVVTIDSVTAHYNKLCRMSIEDLRQNDYLQDSGTTSWYKFDGLAMENLGEEHTARVPSTGEFFLGSKSTDGL